MSLTRVLARCAVLFAQGFMLGYGATSGLAAALGHSADARPALLT